MKAYWEDVIKNVGVGQGFVKITITFGILSYQKWNSYLTWLNLCAIVLYIMQCSQRWLCVDKHKVILIGAFTWITVTLGRKYIVHHELHCVKVCYNVFFFTEKIKIKVWWWSQWTKCVLKKKYCSPFIGSDVPSVLMCSE